MNIDRKQSFGSLVLDRLTNRHLILVGVLADTCCLAYFQLVDQHFFSTDGFAEIYKFLLIRYDARTVWLALAVCVTAAAWRRPRPILSVVDWFGRFPGSIAICAAIAYSIGALAVYHNHPFSMDEYAAAFQSKLFAAGHLYAQLPPRAIDWLIVRVFNGSFFYASSESGHVVEAFWPGFSLLLAPFQFLGVPWACNATLAGAAIYLIFRITLDITHDRRAAGWAMLFTVSSSAFAAYAISYYAMQSRLAVNLLFAILLLRPSRIRALAAGLVGSLAINLHNPFPHVLFAAPWLVSMACDRQQRAKLGLVAVGYLPGLCVAAGWLMLHADILPKVPISEAATSAFRWPGALLLNIRVTSIIKLWLWAPPCLFLLALVGALRNFADRGARLLTLSACFTFAGYCFVGFDQGHGWGYRYFQPAWGCIPILAGVAMARKNALAPSQFTAFAGAVTILSLVLLVPFQLVQMEEIIADHLARIPAPIRPGNNIFFIKPQAGFYIADLIQIDPLLRGPDLILATRGAPLDAQLLRKGWPNARRAASGPWGEQWYIRPTGGGVSSADDSQFDRLNFESSEPKPSR